MNMSVKESVYEFLIAFVCESEFVSVCVIVFVGVHVKILVCACAKS